MMKELIGRGCFDGTITEHDCDLSVLDPCTKEIAAFDEPLDTFLDRRCGPAGTKTIEWPKYDAIAAAAAEAAEAAKAEAEAAALAEQEAINARARAELAKTAKVKIGAIELKGALSSIAVHKLVEEHLDEVRECYGATLATAPTLAGDVKINFVIAGTGKVSAAVVQELTLKDPALGTCIARAIKRLQFPEPRGGGNVIVTVPFSLSPKK